MAGEAGARRLSRDDWTGEALRALAQGGVPAVAIEPIAARLGTTKGSGYWHFRGRADLVAATLLRWEAEHTEAIIAQVESGASPADRMRELFRVVFRHPGAFAVELALLASADDPDVSAAVRRVTRRRLDYLAGLFTELGLAAAEADRRALLVYSTYLGHAQLVRTCPEELAADPTERAAYLDSVLELLLRPPMC